MAESEYCVECGILLDDRAITCLAEDGRLCGEDCMADHLGEKLGRCDDYGSSSAGVDEMDRMAHRRSLYRMIHLFESIRRGHD